LSKLVGWHGELDSAREMVPSPERCLAVGARGGSDGHLGAGGAWSSTVLLL